MKRETWKSEADMCAAFIEWVMCEGWTAYAETAGWDILLLRDGIQVGVQAKLALNAKVLLQALENPWDDGRGPHHRAILVPARNDMARLAPVLGIEVFTARSASHGIDAQPLLRSGWGAGMHDWCPSKLIELPDYVPDVQAGASGPVQLTKWKVGALKLLALLEKQGSVTRDDIRHCNVDYRRWLQPPRWLVPVDDMPGHFKRGESCPAFDQQHPTVYAEILAKTKATRLV